MYEIRNFETNYISYNLLHVNMFHNIYANIKYS